MPLWVSNGMVVGVCMSEEAHRSSSHARRWSRFSICPQGETFGKIFFFELVIVTSQPLHLSDSTSQHSKVYRSQSIHCTSPVLSLPPFCFDLTSIVFLVPVSPTESTPSVNCVSFSLGSGAGWGNFGFTRMFLFALWWNSPDFGLHSHTAIPIKLCVC